MRRWLLLVLRRVDGRGRYHGSGGERRYDWRCGDLCHRNGSTRAEKQKMRLYLEENTSCTDFDNVVFEELHAEDVNHRVVQRALSYLRLRRSIEFKLSLDSAFAFFLSTVPHCLYLCLSSCRITCPRGVVKTPFSSSGIKLVKNSSVKSSNSLTKPRKLARRPTASSDRMIRWRTRSRTAQLVSLSSKTFNRSAKNWRKPKREKPRVRMSSSKSYCSIVPLGDLLLLRVSHG